jgi:hypothetical protein
LESRERNRIQKVLEDAGIKLGDVLSDVRKWRRSRSRIHHMTEKASTIWSEETGSDRNPADEVEVTRPDDQRERYLDAEEISKLKTILDDKMYRKAGKGISQTFFSFASGRSDGANHGHEDRGDFRIEVE